MPEFFDIEHFHFKVPGRGPQNKTKPHKRQKTHHHMSGMDPGKAIENRRKNSRADEKSGSIELIPEERLNPEKKKTQYQSGIQVHLCFFDIRDVFFHLMHEP